MILGLFRSTELSSSKINTQRTRVIGLFVRILIAALAIQSSGTAEAFVALDGSASYSPSKPDDLLLELLQRQLQSHRQINSNDDQFTRRFLSTSFSDNSYGVAISIYEPGRKRLRAFSTNRALAEDVRFAFNALVARPELGSFDLDFKDKTRIQIDFITKPPQKTNPDTLSPIAIDPKRFEVGVDGLLAVTPNNNYYFLPGDAFVRSMNEPQQVVRHLRRSLAGIPADQIRYFRFRTRSFVSYKKTWLRLYRGIPLIKPVDRDRIRAAAAAGIRFVLKNQFPEGHFLYYYDAATDSRRDHEHPTRDPETNPYYNELRHAGGGILLLLDYRLTKDPAILPAVRRSIDWLLGTAVTYKLPDGSDASYFYYNRKSKLGGAGIGLYLISEYQRLSGDTQYRDAAGRLARHLLDSIGPDGEFLYYHIYLDKPVTRADNRRLFSFYYPGEALMGLAGYYKVMADESEKSLLAEKIRLAMKFLLVDRPKVHADHYTKLPSDSWLMMAVNEMWDIPDLREDSYREFVFADADMMVRLMYKTSDSLYPDYPGSFYYNYGDPGYPDGARCEGLMAALELAVKVGDQTKTRLYREALKQAAWATLHLCNTPESAYAVPRPDKTIGGIRFKLTRQWFRVDTIQHVASFYLKFLPYFY